jgi:hypothetical protein
MRFATTFLSNKYRDYAINGETIMDKATGEIFTKRPLDGRVVSFFQNKKYMSDLMLNLRVMLTNNQAFTYPIETDVNACYLSTDYDMMSIYNNTEASIITNDHIIPNGSVSTTKLQFKLSKKTNGFFIRLTTRDTDKAIVEWLTNQYNAACKNYSGTNADFIAEKNKFIQNEKWEDSNAIVNYTLSITTGSSTTNYTYDSYVRINEDSAVIYPSSITTSMLNNASSISVKINSFKYDKFHFMWNHRSTFGSAFTTAIAKFSYDQNVYVRYTNICSFVDNSTDITLLGNEFIVALMDVPYVRRHMMKMSKLQGESTFIVTPGRPTDDVWVTNGIWAEQVREVFKGGYTVNKECEVNLKKLEKYIADNDNTSYVNFNTSNVATDIYIHS